jgi:integrase
VARKYIDRNIYFDERKKHYIVTLYFGLDEKGHTIRKMESYTLLKDARAALRAHETGRDNGLVVAPAKKTLSEWLNYWLKNIVVPKVESTTLYGYLHIINNHINPNLGHLDMQSIRPIIIQKYYTKLLQETKLSPNTVIKHHHLLTTAFKAAVKQEVLIKSPMDGVEPPRKINKEASVYNIEQLQELLKKVEGDERLETMVKICAYLGLRRGEACGLKWDDIDFESRTLTVRETRTMAGSDVIIKEPKTSSSIRKLHISDGLYDALQKELNRQQKNKNFFGMDYVETDYVLVNANGETMRPNHLSEAFASFIKKMACPRCGFMNCGIPLHPCQMRQVYLNST